VSQPASIIAEDLQPTFEGEPLPDGWRWVRLGDIGDVVNGYGFAEHLQGRTDLPFPFIKVSDMNASNAETVISRAANTVDEAILKQLRARTYPAGTVIFPKVGGALLTNKKRLLGAEATFDNNVMGIVPKEVDSQFLFYWMQSFDLRTIANIQALPSIRQSDVAALKIPLPPNPEQKRIAAILKEQMAAVERARAAAEAQLKAARDLPAAYLCAVFDSLEARQWEKKSIGDVALSIQNGIYKAAEHYGHGHPFLRMYNIQNNSWMLNLDRIALVNLEGKEEQTFALKRGDLLISRVNSFELVGKCAWVNSNAEGFVFENMLIRVRLDSSVNPLFVAQQMATNAVRKQVEAVAKRAIGQASINSADLRAIEIALPALGVQEQMANELSARVAGAEQASKALQDQLNTINKLPAALLRQAFTGKL
jgi:type I restriction enzyme S subunit